MVSATALRRRVGPFVAAMVAIVVFTFVLLELRYNILPYVQIDDATGSLEALLVALISLAVVSAGLQFFGIFFEGAMERRTGSHAQARSTWRLVSYLVWGVALMAIFVGVMGGLASAAVSFGLIGLGLTLVLQKPLFAVAAWIVITFNGVYRIGDRVEVGGIKGYVTDVRLTHTALREFGSWMHGDTFTGRVVYLTNGAIFDSPVYNYTRDAPFLWDEIENLVTYESDIDAAREHMIEAARQVVGDYMAEAREVYRQQVDIRDLKKVMLTDPEVRMTFADSGVRLFVLYYCPADARRRLQSRIVEDIWRRFQDDPRVEIAYPHMELVRYEPKHGPAGGGKAPAGGKRASAKRS